MCPSEGGHHCRESALTASTAAHRSHEATMARKESKSLIRQMRGEKPGGRRAQEAQLLPPVGYRSQTALTPPYPTDHAQPAVPFTGP
ncbi:hypothetical protein MTO96_017057 [Rhipicephalus appendiculatus]